MIKKDCDICGGKDIPQNETIGIDGQTYCKNCFESNFTDKAMLEGRSVERILDPTVCNFCQKDFGNVALGKISTYPICSDCETDIKNKTFPSWVKAFFVGILAIMIGGFIWNWKFYEAYRSFNKANESAQQGDYKTASLLLDDASNKVPEAGDLRTLQVFYSGLDFLSKDKNAEAIVAFDQCKNKLPHQFPVNELRTKARMGLSFNSKDYEGFLAASKENLDADTTQAISYASVASAYACIYAQTGEDSTRQNALVYLRKAKAIDSTGTEAKDYYNIVEYRLYSRKIITRDEFRKQFPNGWTKN